MNHVTHPFLQLAMGETNQEPSPNKRPDAPRGTAEKQAEVKKVMNEFPKKIPGAATVEHYPTEGALFCLVHLRQRHESPDTLKEKLAALKASDIPPDRLKDLEQQAKERRIQGDREVTAVHRDIHRIVSHLGVKEVYSEGNTHENQSEFDWLSQSLSQVDKVLKRSTTLVQELTDKLRAQQLLSKASGDKNLTEETRLRADL